MRSAEISAGCDSHYGVQLLLQDAENNAGCDKKYGAQKINAGCDI